MDVDKQTVDLLITIIGCICSVIGSAMYLGKKIQQTTDESKMIRADIVEVKVDLSEIRTEIKGLKDVQGELRERVAVLEDRCQTRCR